MTEIDDFYERQLGCTSPDFMGYLDTDPDLAMEHIGRLLYALLFGQPNRRLRSIPEEKRRDAAHYVYICFVQNEFRVMRRYVDQGVPFRHWFAVAVNNHLANYIKKESRYDKYYVPIDPSPEEGDRSRERPDEGDLPPDEALIHKEELKRVEQCLETLPPECRYVLLARGRGYSGEEIAQQLWTWPEDSKERKRLAKKVLDDAREYRRMLVTCLQRRGSPNQRQQV
jgi:RNA polymerase sigma factor (sigma-70 family)